MELVMRFRKSKISWYKQEQLIEHFVAGTTARCTSELLHMNRNTVWLYFHRLREIIAHELELASDEMFSGEIEVDESYFGGVRKGKRGRGAGGKTIVFGLLKRGGKVYTKIVPNVKKKTLMPNIKDKVVPDSIVYTDSLRSYNALDVSEFKHKRINHCKTFVDGYNHINGIENFWNQAKRHMRKFNGISKDNFMLYLKECEWRFNHSEIQSQKIHNEHIRQRL